MSCPNSFLKKTNPTAYVPVTSAAMENGDEKTVPPVSILKLSFYLDADQTDKNSSGILGKSTDILKEGGNDRKRKNDLRVMFKLSWYCILT